jgi:hypothetical protein
MRKILLLSLLVNLALSAAAQSGNKISLSVDGDFNIPFNTNNYYYGHTRDYYKDGLGTDIKLELPIIKTLHFTASAGFAWYNAQLHYIIVPDNSPLPNGVAYTQTGGITSYKYLPLKAGLRYYFIKYLYAGIEAGDAIKLNSYALSSFIYTGEAGVVIPIDLHNSLGLEIQYARGFKSLYYPAAMSQLSLGVAYKFGW